MKGRRSIDKLQARLALLPSALLYATGLALCLLIGQRLPFDPAEIVLTTCLITLALCALLYNRYTILAALVAAGIAALIAWRALPEEELAALIEQAQIRVDYVVGFLTDAAVPDEQYAPSLYAAIMGLCAAASALIVYRLRSALIASLLALGLFMLQWSLGAAGILAALWPTMIGCALLFAIRGFQQSPRKPVQTVALALAASLLAAGACAALVPKDTSGLRTAFVERALDNVNDVFSDYTGFQRRHYSFSIAEMGYQPLGDRLGGAVQLTDAEVLKVSAISPGLLKGVVRNYYSGSYWTRSASIRTYRLGNPFIGGRQRDIMGTAIPDVPELESFFAREMDIAITHLAPFRSTLFTVGRPRVVDPADGDIITNFDENAEVFAKRTVPTGSSYAVSARVLNTDKSAFEGVLDTMYQRDLLDAPTPEVKERNAFLYLGLPEDFPDWVRQTSAQVVQGAGGDWDKANALRDYLSKNFTYTLDPVDPPEGEDFVAHFLSTGEGYCTYFASAMAVMARCAGIPSRYVEGFLLEGSTRTSGGYLVSGTQAHAWAELYIEGLGWMPFDATPRQSTGTSGAAGGLDIPEMPTPTPEPLEDFSTEEIDLPYGSGFRIPWWAYPIAGAIALVAVFFSLIARHDRRWETDRLKKRLQDPIAQLSAIWGDSLHILSRMGLPLKPGETMLTFASRVDRAVDNPEGALRPIAEASVRARYGGIAPTPAEVERANAYRGELDVRLRRTGGRIRFLFARALRRAPW